jgi:hypothetical protein
MGEGNVNINEIFYDAGKNGYALPPKTAANLKSATPQQRGLPP